MNSDTNRARRTIVGWLYVTVQFIAIGLLVLLPGSDDWPMQPWLVLVGRICTIAGFIVMAIAALHLGSSLTPTPVPRKHGQLRTGGFYQVVRHPIYSGVLLAVAGLVVLSSSWLHVFIGVATAVFFNQKAIWEENQLCERYEDYERHMKQTPRFIPWRWLKQKLLRR